MITKDMLSAAMTRECDIAVHLFTKVKDYDYRPTPGQRSTLELLRYLAVCGIAGVRCMSEGSWDHYGEYAARVKEMKAEEFPAMMELQKKEIAEFFEKVSEETLETKDAPLPGGFGSVPLGIAILNGPFKWITAYKLQLFLYAKSSGASDIGTINAWGGMDAKK